MNDRYYVVVNNRVYEFDFKDYKQFLEAGSSGIDAVLHVKTYGGRFTQLPRISYGNRQREHRIDPLNWRSKDYAWELNQLSKRV
ncbi:MAG: hypothetical protein Unbinned1446contig1005_41 [Prokaryotic dsDNA virus sp.]|nr:MAG: hypothetical protein Unbinned1446contig1005_41 [Prokaryotic dsDNA virus sp.]|tara:strand:+ start:4614 stop:4865 length:252 start_codon:yes stop_codon:yes gene_type:complete